MLLNPPLPAVPPSNLSTHASLSRAPSRYRGKRKPPSTALNNNATPPTQQQQQQQQQQHSETSADKPYSPPPPPLHSAPIEPISLGYKKVYHKDSAASQEAVYGTTISTEALPPPATDLAPFPVDESGRNPATHNPFVTSSSSPSTSPGRTQNPPVSTVFNPLNPFLTSLPTPTTIQNTDSSNDANKPSLDNFSDPKHSHSPQQQDHLSSAFEPRPDSRLAPPAASDTSDHSSSLHLPNSPSSSPRSKSKAVEILQEKLKISKRHLESVGRSMTHNVAKPTNAPALDEIHAQYAATQASKASARATIKFHYPFGVTEPNGNSGFVESLLLDQSFTAIIKAITAKHQHVLSSDDPDDYMLWEICPSLGLRRPLRSTELLRFIYESWPSVTSNYLQLDSSESRLDVSSIAFLTPRRDVLQAGPSGPSYYAKMYYQVGPKSWKKCYLTVHNLGLTISRKPGAIDQVASKDKRIVSQLCEFDIYEVSAAAISKAPGNYTMAIRSQLRGDIFVDKKDSVHIFATDNSQDYAAFRTIVFTLRAQACEKAARLRMKESTSNRGSGSSTPGAAAVLSNDSSNYQSACTSPKQLSARLGNINLDDVANTTEQSLNPFRERSESYTQDNVTSPQDSLSPSSTISSAPSSSSSSFEQPRRPSNTHETLLEQQKHRKIVLQQTQMSHSFNVTQHNHPTLIDSIGPHNNPNIPESDRKNFDRSISDIDSYGNGGPLGFARSGTISHKHGDESGALFQPDSLLAQMSSRSYGAPPPSVASVAAAKGIQRHNTTARAPAQRQRSPFKRTLTVSGGTKS